MPTALPTWPSALPWPGITVLPASATRCVPAGIVTADAAPTATTLPPRTRIVALSIGGLSVPSSTRAPGNAIGEPDCCAGVAIEHIAAATQASNHAGDFMTTL